MRKTQPIYPGKLTPAPPENSPSLPRKTHPSPTNNENPRCNLHRPFQPPHLRNRTMTHIQGPKTGKLRVFHAMGPICVDLSSEIFSRRGRRGDKPKPYYSSEGPYYSSPSSIIRLLSHLLVSFPCSPVRLLLYFFLFLGLPVILFFFCFGVGIGVEPRRS